MLNSLCVAGHISAAQLSLGWLYRSLSRAANPPSKMARRQLGRIGFAGLISVSVFLFKCQRLRFFAMHAITRHVPARDQRFQKQISSGRGVFFLRVDGHTHGSPTPCANSGVTFPLPEVEFPCVCVGARGACIWGCTRGSAC